MQLMKFFGLGQNPKPNLTASKPKTIGSMQNPSNARENVGDLQLHLKNILLKNKTINNLKCTSGNITIQDSEIINNLDITSGDADISNAKIKGKTELMNGKTKISNSTLSEIDGHNQSILICDSNVNGKLNNMNNGDINAVYDETLKTSANTAIINSNVYGDIDNMNGVIGISDSNIAKNINATNGKLIIQNSKVQGDVRIVNGNLKIQNSSIKKVIVPTNCLNLNGAITIENLELSKSVDVSKPDDIKTITGRAFINAKENPPNNNLENCFKLQKGTILESNITFLKEHGILIIEEGAAFIGKVSNGSIMNKSLKGLCQRG